MKFKHVVFLSFLPFATVAWADDNLLSEMATASDPVMHVDNNAGAENSDVTSSGNTNVSGDGTNHLSLSTPDNEDSPYIRSLQKRHIERVNRDALKATFIPKGQWMFGGTINFHQWDADQNDFLVLKDMQYNAYTFSGSPYFGYFVKNNMAIGGRYSYSRNQFQLDKLGLNLGEDFNISLEDLYYIGHKYQASLFLRNYMPIGKSKIFGFFTEIDATYSLTNSKNTTGRIENKNFDGTYLKTNTIQLGFMPGLSAFVTDFAAVECSIGVMGLNYKWGDATANRIEKNEIKSGGANFQFNLFSVNLGMTFYL